MINNILLPFQVVSFTPKKHYKTHSYYGNVTFYVNWNAVMSPMFYTNLYYIDQAKYKRRWYTRVLITKSTYPDLQLVNIEEPGSPLKKINGIMHAAHRCTTSDGSLGVHELQISVEADSFGCSNLYKKAVKVANDHSQANSPSEIKNPRARPGCFHKYRSYICFKFNTAQNKDCPYQFSPLETQEVINLKCPGMLTPIEQLGRMDEEELSDDEISLLDELEDYSDDELKTSSSETEESDADSSESDVKSRSVVNERYESKYSLSFCNGNKINTMPLYKEEPVPENHDDVDSDEEFVDDFLREFEKAKIRGDI